MLHAKHKIRLLSLDEVVFFKRNVYILFCFLAVVGDPGPWGLDPGFRIKKILDPDPHQRI